MEKVMQKTYIGITTYNKPDILTDILVSLQENGYTENTEIVVADDAPGSDALQVCREIKFVKSYLCGNRHGICYNKNRLIKHFFESSDAERLLLLDHDILLLRPGLLQELENAHNSSELLQQHLNLFVQGLDGSDGLETTFPRQGENDHIRWAQGSHGVGLWFTRDLAKKTGYMLKYPYFYGGEHAEYSQRALAIQGYAWDLYPTLKHSARYISLNPRDYHLYDVDLDRVYSENHTILHARSAKTARGVELKEYSSHLDREVVVSREGMNTTTPQAILDGLRPPKKTGKRRRR